MQQHRTKAKHGGVLGVVVLAKRKHLRLEVRHIEDSNDHRVLKTVNYGE